MKGIAGMAGMAGMMVWGCNRSDVMGVGIDRIDRIGRINMIDRIDRIGRTDDVDVDGEKGKDDACGDVG